MERFLEISTHLSNPLALAGFFGATFFLILRQLIAKNIFPILTKQVSGSLFRLIIDKLFLLSLVAMILGFLGFVFVVIVERNAATMHSPQSKNTQHNSGQSNNIVGSYNILVQGDKNNIGANSPATEEKIDLLNKKADVLLSQTERQPQIAMASFVKFTVKKKTWTAPNEIFPGSIVELYGFKCHLHISTDAGFWAEIMGEGWQKSKEVVIVGKSGVPSKWKISTDSSCEGKVVVFSSPRIRALRNSWDEEGVKAR